MDFVAIDVETANADRSTICQVGLVTVADGAVVATWSSLVDPEAVFDGINIEIHGIDETAVRGAPKFPGIHGAFKDAIGNNVVVSHTAFDRSAVHRVLEKYSLPGLANPWLDSARVARRAWPERYAKRGYGLANIARDLGFEFKHHDALEDARAAAEILLRAADVTGLDIAGWSARVEQPVHGAVGGGKLRRQGNPEGPLFGEVLVFTGALRLSRGAAADLAARAGCGVAGGVTKKTTILVVGDQDAHKLAGHDKSRKHRKAEEHIAAGQSIHILTESDFESIAALAPVQDT